MSTGFRYDSIWLCCLTRSFSDHKPLKALLGAEATESHVAPVAEVIP